MNNRKAKNVLIIYAKRPEVGKVKTRIAKETSDEFAYDIARLSFIDLVNKLRGSDYYDLIVGVDTASDLYWFQKNFAVEGLVFKKKPNLSKVIGQSCHFEDIFSDLLDNKKCGYKKAILIPMDIPFISEEDIIAAFSYLSKNRFVLGPEINGGVYLIGVKAPYQGGGIQGCEME